MKKITYCTLFSLFLLLTCSKCSILYPINDWNDANVFFTVGKSWMNGLIPYKMIFEQKGPILFLIYGIGYLITNKSFLGCFILETISFTIFLFIILKTLNLIYKSKIKYYILVLYAYLMVTSIAFYGGASAEEFCLPFLGYNLYLLVTNYKKIEITEKQFFLNGIFCSIVFLIKFNITSFWISFILINIIDSIKNKKKIIKKVLFFSFGFIIPIMVTVIYFAINSSLNSLIDAYIIKNIFTYANVKIGINNIATGIDNLFCINIQNDIVTILLLLFYIVYSLIFSKEKLHNLILFIIPFITIAGINQWYEYYFLPFFIFIFIALIWIVRIIKEEKILKLNLYLLIAIICILTPIFSENAFMLKYDKKNFVHYKFSEIINKYEDKTILNYGFIDGGFFLHTDTIPTLRFYHTMNFPDFKEMEEAQLGYIKNKKTNFVITINTSQENIQKNQNEILKKNYDLIKIERHNKDYGLYYGLYKAKE